MDDKQIVELIKRRRAEYQDLTFAAGPGTGDIAAIDAARRALEFVEEYDKLLEIIEGKIPYFPAA